MFPRARIVRIAIGLATTALAFGVLIGLGLAGYYNLAFALSIVNGLLLGLSVTVRLVAVAIPVGFGVGLLVGSARTSHSWFARATGATYVEFFRSLPPLVLSFFAFLIAVIVARRLLFVEDPSGFAIAVGLLALALHSAGYQAEIIRAGILSVPAGQVEAAEALGMVRRQTLFRVVLPQAFRVSLPALANEFASLIKDTSLLSAIGVLELALWGGIYTNEAVFTDFNLVFIVWVEILLLYFALTFVVTRSLRTVENRFKVPGLEAAQV